MRGIDPLALSARRALNLVYAMRLETIADEERRETFRNAVEWQPSEEELAELWGATPQALAQQAAMMAAFGDDGEVT